MQTTNWPDAIAFVTLIVVLFWFFALLAKRT